MADGRTSSTAPPKTWTNPGSFCNNAVITNPRGGLQVPQPSAPEARGNRRRSSVIRWTRSQKAGVFPGRAGSAGESCSLIRGSVRVGARASCQWLEAWRCLALESSGTEGIRGFDLPAKIRVRRGALLSICDPGGGLHNYVSTRALWRAKDRATSSFFFVACRVLMISQRCQCRAGSSVQAGGTRGARLASYISSRLHTFSSTLRCSPRSLLAFSAIEIAPRCVGLTLPAWANSAARAMFNTAGAVGAGSWAPSLPCPFPFPMMGRTFSYGVGGGGTSFPIAEGGCGVSPSNTAGEPQGRPVCTRKVPSWGQARR